MITIDIRDLERVRMKVKRLGKNIPIMGRRTIHDIGIEFRRNLRANAPIWRGDLRNSISMRTIDEKTVGIFMAEYGARLEEPQGPQIFTPLLRSWAFEKSIAPFSAIETVLTSGVRAHPWIRPSFEQTKPLIDTIILRNMAFAIKDAGFRTGG